MKLKSVTRLDSQPLNKAFFTEEGYLIDTPIVTTTGIFEYVNSDGSVRYELRLPEEVFDPDSLASYTGKPVIITHDAGLVTKDNVSDEATRRIGTILTPGKRDGDNVRAQIVIHDTDEMKKSHLKELSLGYNLDLDETPGEWEGKHYDAIQRNIRINHLALVREARAGNTARLNIDSRDKIKNERKGEDAMSKVAKKKAKRADGVLSAEELEKAIADYKAKKANKDADDTPEEKVMPVEGENPEDVDKVDDDIEEEKKENTDSGSSVDDVEKLDEDDTQAEIKKLHDIIDTLLAQRDFNDAKPAVASDGEDCEGDCKKDGEDDDPDKEDEDDEEREDEDEDDREDDDEEEDREDDDDEEIPEDEKKGAALNEDSVDKIIRTRVKIGIAAEKLNLDGLENMKLRDAKKAIVKAVRPSMNLDGKGKAYIDAAFNMACDDLKKSTRKDTKYQRKQMFNGDSKQSRGFSSAEDHRQQMIDRNLNKKKEDK